MSTGKGRGLFTMIYVKVLLPTCDKMTLTVSGEFVADLLSQKFLVSRGIFTLPDKKSFITNRTLAS